MISYTLEGYFLESATADSPHALCGSQRINGATSPNTGQPLLLLLSLDPTDPRLGIPHLKLNALHLLYSWTCGISGGVFSYRESSEGVEIIAYTKGPLQADFPYANYPPFFSTSPGRTEDTHTRRTGAHRTAQQTEVGPAQLGRQFPQLSVPRSQLGGEPRLLQWPLRPWPLPCLRRKNAAVG